MAADDEKHFEYALGFAVERRWADLSRATQQRLFDEATAGGLRSKRHIDANANASHFSIASRIWA